MNSSGKLIGLTTANDVLENYDKAEKVSEIMKEEVYFVTEDANVSQVLSIMAQKQVGNVPVIGEKNKLVGLITRASLVNVLGEHLTA